MDFGLEGIAETITSIQDSVIGPAEGDETRMDVEEGRW